MTRPYDPPAALEGPDKGLTEMVAEMLWRRRSYAAERHSWRKQSDQVKVSWRKCAAAVIDRLIDMGFAGPAGHPPITGLSYAWMWECAEWEIHDGSKGFVALIREEADVPLILAAPKMAVAIRNLLERLGDDPAAKMPEIAALAEATKGLERLTFDVEETDATTS